MLILEGIVHTRKFAPVSPAVYVKSHAAKHIRAGRNLASQKLPPVHAARV
jgi:hypothetical protein